MYFDGCVHIEEDDQCFTCVHFVKGVSCPLLEALATGVVYLEGDVGVKNCGFYKKHVRHLSALKPTGADLDPAAPLASENPEKPDMPSVSPSKIHRLRR